MESRSLRLRDMLLAIAMSTSVGVCRCNRDILRMTSSPHLGDVMGDYFWTFACYKRNVLYSQ